MLNPLNSTMLATALTTLCHSFSKDISEGPLLIVPLYVTAAICMPLMGRLADVFSAKRINTAGLILVFISVLIGIWAPDFKWMIVSRTILGVGTSAAYPSVMAIIKKRYTEQNIEVPGRILGWVSMASQISIVIGPVLGGIITEFMGWRGIFYINIPLVVTALYFSKYISLPSARPVRFNNEVLKKLDLPGALLFTLSLITLLVVLMTDTSIWLCIPILIILLIVLILWELKQDNPFIHVRMLIDKPTLSVIYMRSALTNLVFFALIYALPQWLQETKGINPSHSGFIMLPLSLASASIAYLSSRSNNYLRLLVYGLLSLGIACTGLLNIHADSSLIFITGMTLLFGISIGLNIIANQASLYAEVPVEYTGISFGLFRTVGNIGTILSGSELKEIFSHGATDHALHKLATYSLICCGLIFLLLIPLIKKYLNKKSIQPIIKSL